MTLKDVAQASGVHPATVSRFMNARDISYVGAKTAERILKVAEELGYKRNMQAAGLRGRLSHTIGILVTSITYPVFPPLIDAIQSVAKRAGYVCYVQSLSEDPTDVTNAVDHLLAHQVDGIVLASSYDSEAALQTCAAAGVPVTLVFSHAGANHNLRVLSDDGEGSALMARHLTGLGHRRIAHVSGPAALGSSRTRQQSFMRMLDEADLPQPAEYFLGTASHTREAGREAMFRLLALAEPPTAVATASDFLALGCYDALKEAGLKCPDDVSVVGYEDIGMCDLMTPPLTTIHTSLTEIGERSAEMLLDAIAGKLPAAPVAMFHPTLMVRGSTAEPKRSRQ